VWPIYFRWVQGRVLTHPAFSLYPKTKNAWLSLQPGIQTVGHTCLRATPRILHPPLCSRRIGEAEEGEGEATSWGTLWGNLRE